MSGIEFDDLEVTGAGRHAINIEGPGHITIHGTARFSDIGSHAIKMNNSSSVKIKKAFMEDVGGDAVHSVPDSSAILPNDLKAALEQLSSQELKQLLADVNNAKNAGLKGSTLAKIGKIAPIVGSALAAGANIAKIAESIQKHISPM